MSIVTVNVYQQVASAPNTLQGTGALISLAVAIAPESEFILRGHSYGGQIKCVALIALLIVALRCRFVSAFDSAG